MLDEEKPSDDSAPDRVEINPINDAFDFLFEGLAKANRMFVEEKDAGREGAVAALNVVTKFLSFFQGTTDHRQPLTALLNAVMSLDEGLVLPLLKQARRPRGGQSPASHARGPRCTGFAKPGSPK